MILPKVISVPTLTKIMEQLYMSYNETGRSNCLNKYTLRDIAVTELLFATGIRDYELKACDVNLKDTYIKVYGKGSKGNFCQKSSNK